MELFLAAILGTLFFKLDESQMVWTDQEQSLGPPKPLPLEHMWSPLIALILAGFGWVKLIMSECLIWAFLESKPFEIKLKCLKKMENYQTYHRQWNKVYFLYLQKRLRWLNNIINIQVGDKVLLHENHFWWSVPGTSTYFSTPEPVSMWFLCYNVHWDEIACTLSPNLNGKPLQPSFWFNTITVLFGTLY